MYRGTKTSGVPAGVHNAIGENFMRQEHARMWQVAQTPQEAVDAIQNIPVWDKNIRKIAAI